jgi:YVTN family beta-propeller protein
MKTKRTPLSKLFLLAGLVLLGLNSCRENENPEPEKEPVVPVEAGKIYAANEHAGTISVIDAATRKVTKTIAINTGPVAELMAHNVQVAPDGKTVWVTGVPMDHTTTEELIVIDAAADTLLRRIPLSAHLHMAHIVFSPDSKNAFVTATDANIVFQVNALTYKVTRDFMLGANHEPHGLRYSGGKLYVANMKANSISEIEVATGQVAEIPVGGVAVQTAVSPNGKYVFASLYDTKEVVRYNLQTQVLDRIALPATAQGPIQLYPSPDGKKLFVCDQGVLLSRRVSDKVFVIDIEKATVVNTITVGNASHGVVVSRDGKTAYSTNTNDGTVSVIDVASEKVVGTIPVGLTPNGISYRYETGGMP